MGRIRFYLGLAIGVLLTLFALQNLQLIHVHMFVWLLELPLVAIMFGSVFIGALWASLWLAMARWCANRVRTADNHDGVSKQPSH